MGQDNEVVIPMDIDVEAKPPKYQEGDKVFCFFLSGNKTAIISKICDKTDSNGYPIYEIIDEEGVTHEVCETLFDEKESLIAKGFLLDKDGVINRSANDPYIDLDQQHHQEEQRLDDSYIEKIRQENEAAMNQIINSLGLKSSEDPMEQLQNCCRLQAYMAENNRYNNNVMEEKETYSENHLVDIDLHNALVKKSGVCTSNSLMFQSILSKLGISVESVGLRVEPDSFHMANIVLIYGEWYFFDTTLEATIRSDNIDKELLLCCAGLGSEDYCKFYTPRCIVRKDGLLDLPENISKERIPFAVVNGFFDQPTTGEKSI